MSQFEIIAGTYEEYLLGYIFSPKDKTFTQSFASHDHSASIKCLASSGNYTASGGSDDRIIIYDLKARKEHCMLTHHDSSITAVAFTNNHSHVVSASQDGALAIVRVGNWQLEKLWKNAHKEGTILDIALHSSGKLALTLGSNATIHTWNLVKGREAFIINLKSKCKDPKSLERILFAPDDNRFLIFGGKYTEIWSMKVGGVLEAIEHEQKVTCCAWLDNERIFIGYEDGQIGTINLENGDKVLKQGHDGRVKAVQIHEGYLVTASSMGEIKVWTFKLKELCKTSTGCRITCLVVAKWTGHIKKEEDEEVEVIHEVPKQSVIKSCVVVEVDSDNEEVVVKKKKTKHIENKVESKSNKSNKKHRKRKILNK